MVKYLRGFTLIELMIVVALIAIVAAIAYPSYQESVLKTKRTEAQAEMLDVAQRLQRFKIANFSFVPIVDDEEVPVDLAQLQHSGNMPNQGQHLYTLDLINVTPTSWTLVATPIAGQQMEYDGVICLNHRQQKFWSKGVTACNLSANSNWTGK